MYVIHAGGNRTSGFSSPGYIFCTIVLLGYLAIPILMILGENSKIRSDGLCVIGLKDFAFVHYPHDFFVCSSCHMARSIPLLVYNLVLNLCLTSVFIWPLWRSATMSPRLKSLMKRTLMYVTANVFDDLQNNSLYSGAMANFVISTVRPPLYASQRRQALYLFIVQCCNSHLTERRRVWLGLPQRLHFRSMYLLLHASMIANLSFLH